MTVCFKLDQNASILVAFKVADDVLRHGVQGISDLVCVPGLINLDFADVRTVMMDTGSALMGIGVASGENKAREAAMQAIASPLLEATIEGAKGVLMNVTGGPDLGIFEVNEAAEIIMQAADPGATIIFGAVINEEFDDTIQITVIATGFDNTPGRRLLSRREPLLKVDTGDLLEVPEFLRRAKSREKPR